MKKTYCVMAVAILCVATSAFAQEALELRVVDSATGLATVDIAAAGDPVNVAIQGRLNTATSDGLALWGSNMTAGGTYAAGYDLCDDVNSGILTAPGTMLDFMRNLGLTNPNNLGGGTVEGYSGTCDGSMGLWQLGGGQNTINNTDPPVYPVGGVSIGVANGATWTDLATGTYATPGDMADGETIILSLDTCFANTIDAGQGGPVYNVTAAICTAAGGLTITLPGCTTVIACPDADVNCDNAVTALDIAAVASSANFGFAAGAAANPRADVNGDGTVTALDIAAVSSSACFGQP